MGGRGKGLVLLVGSLDGGTVLLVLGGSLGNEGVVLSDGLLLSQSPPLLQAPQMSPPLQPQRGHQPLNLRRLGVRLSSLLLRGDLPPNHKLPHIILLAQVEEPPNLGGTLGSQPLGEDGVGQTGDLGFTLFDDDDGEDGNVVVDDAAADGFPLAFAGAAGAVARVALGEEETGSVGEEDTLLHGETLLVVSSSDLYDVALEFISKCVAQNLLAHALVVEDTDTPFVVYIDELLLAGAGICEI